MSDEIKLSDLPKVTLPLGPKGGLRRLPIHEALELLLRRVEDLESERQRAREGWI